MDRVAVVTDRAADCLPRQVAGPPGHSTSKITELYCVKKDNTRLAGITTGFEL